MCGFAGVLLADGAPGRQALEADALQRMSDALVHRGPDDAGTFVDEAAGIALGHRRLSIIDLSPEGHQPMASACGRYVIAFNGEIYNFRELRAALEPLGHRFRGHSDTEVLLAGISAWGLDATLGRANGMFAFALWDRANACLHLVRDRIGKKPLYYGWTGHALVFGSELKALLAHPQFEPVVSRDALALLLRFDYIPAPWSIYRNVFKLVAGTVVTFTARNVAAGAGAHEPRRDARYYWNPAERAAAAIAAPLGNAQAALDALDTLLADAVRLRMYADVPLGAFLSGGTDSSLVTAMMQAQSTRPVLTFSIGFDDPRHDESDHARAVASHLGTEHTELHVTGADALGVVPDLPAIFDEPFADSSEVPSCLVARLARKRVTVALSGDGGDELFGGYGRYLRALRIWRMLERCPAPLRYGLARSLGGFAPPEARGSGLTSFVDELRAGSPESVYLNRVSRWRRPGRALPGAVEPDTVFTRPQLALRGGEPGERLMFLDAASYLPEDILTKVDRTSMAVSLEARAPLLDYRVVELAWRIPVSLKLRAGSGKWLLKQLLRRYLPEALVERPKRGFGAPVGEWLRGPLREWAEALLASERLEREQHFDAGVVREVWSRFLAGERKWHTHLWSIVMFEAWLDWVAAYRARAR